MFYLFSQILNMFYEEKEFILHYVFLPCIFLLIQSSYSK